MSRLKILKDAEAYSRMEYPRVGQPLQTIAMVRVGEVHNRWMPHIIHSDNVVERRGEYLNYWVESEERAWEITANEVAKRKRDVKI